MKLSIQRGGNIAIQGISIILFFSDYFNSGRIIILISHLPFKYLKHLKLSEQF